MNVCSEIGWGLQDTSESTIELQTNPREDYAKFYKAFNAKVIKDGLLDSYKTLLTMLTNPLDAF